MTHMNSIQDSYIRLIKNKEIKVVSFDLFDTLVFRKTFKPSDAFKLFKTSKSLDQCVGKPEQFYFKRIKAEEIARQKISLEKEDLNLEDIYNELNLPIYDKESLLNEELEIENKLIFANEQTDDWIRIAHSLGKEIIIVSDMYMIFSQINRVALSKLKNKNLINRVYISGEIGKLKSTGSLFEYVIKNENLKPRNLLHIGDNIYGDYLVPKSKGIRSIYYGLSQNLRKVYDLEKNYIKNNLYDIQHIRTITSINKPHYDFENQSTLYEIGAYIFGPIMYSFAEWILEFTLKNRCTKIFCVTREGHFFKKVLECFKNKNPRYININVDLLYASRSSLFLPFLNNNFDLNKELIYNDISIEEVYQIVGIKIKNSKIKSKKEVSFKNSSSIKIGNVLFSDIINDDLITRKDEVIESVKKKKILILKYFNQIKLDENSVVLDFGGGGSILNSIFKISGNGFAHKYCLFYEHEKVFELPFKVNTFLPLDDSNINHDNFKILKLAPIIETLFNGDEKTTIGYKSLKKRIYPLQRGKFSNNKVSFNAFNKGVLDFFTNTKRFNRNISFKSLNSRKSFSSIITRLLSVPTAEEADGLGKLPFEKDYKSEIKEKIINTNSMKSIESFGVSEYLLNIFKNKEYFWANTIWPELQLSLKDESILPNLYNLNDANKITADALLSKFRKTNYKKISIYGIGLITDKILPLLTEIDVKILNYIDSSAEYKELFYHSKKVISPMESIEAGDRTFLLATGVFQNEMRSNLLDVAKAKSLKINIIALD